MHYKDSVSLQVSATISGIGEAIFWVPITLVAVHFCKKYHKVAPMLSEESCFAKMAGIMFPIFILNDVSDFLIFEQCFTLCSELLETCDVVLPRSLKTFSNSLKR